MIAAVTNNNGIPRPRPKPRFVFVAEEDLELDDSGDVKIEEEGVIALADGVKRGLDKGTKVEAPAVSVVNIDVGLFADEMKLPKTVEVAPGSVAGEILEKPEEEETLTL